MIALTLLIFLVGALVQSVSGFGFMLVAAPLVAITDSPRTAVICGTTLGLVMTLGRTVADRDHVDWPITWRILGWSILGMPAGVVALRGVPDQILAGAIAVIVLACTVLVWRAWRWHIQGWRIPAVGVLCGVLTTSTGTNGPPLVAALQAVGTAPRAFRATMAALLTVTGVVGVAALVIGGVTTAHDWLISALGVPVVAFANWCGTHVIKRVDATRFRHIVLSALVASSAIALAHAATPW
jgi:uncharacterized membrane protein YfcA